MALEVQPVDILKVRERGLDNPPPMPPVGELPPSGGQWPVPHFQSKVGLINYLSRTYKWTFDEAVRNSRENAVAMLRDLVIRDALASRFIPITQLAWHLEAYDETDPVEVDAARVLTEVIEKTPYWEDFLYGLLMGVWGGRAGEMLIYDWDFSDPSGARRLLIKHHRPINGDTLISRWDNEWGQLVNYEYEGTKEIGDGRGFAHYYTPEEKEAVIIHTHVPEDVDYYEFEMAGAIRGVGLRGHLYWYWFLKSNYLAILSDYAERFCNGVWIAYFDESNPTGKQDMEAAIAGYRSNRVLSLPRLRNGETAFGVDIEEVGTATPTFLLDILREINALMVKYITGNSLNEGSDISVGGDAAAVVTDRIGRALKWDASRLASTLNAQLLPVLNKYNCPNCKRAPKFVFDLETPNASDVIGYATAIHALGGDLDLSHLYKVAGLPEPGPGATVSSKLQPMSATATASVPQGVPMTQPSPQLTQSAVS